MMAIEWVTGNTWRGVETAARWVWTRTFVKELVLMVGAAVAVVMLTQLQALNAILDEGVSVEDLKVWLEATGVAVGVTAVKQALAWAMAKLAGTKL